MRLVSSARVIEPHLLEHILEMEDQHVVFRKGHPLLARVEIMDILVAPTFLRRVVRVEHLGDSVRFDTRDAGLEEIMW
jgi:hypothetical protein